MCLSLGSAFPVDALEVWGSGEGERDNGCWQAQGAEAGGQWGYAPHSGEGDVMMRFPDCVWPHPSVLTSA